MSTDPIGQRNAGPMNRRRFISIAGTYCGASAIVGNLPGAAAHATANPEAGMQLNRWQGQALGAWADIKLYHPSPIVARRALVACTAEIERLEDLFSLYRPKSILNRLNKDGLIDNPDPDFAVLMQQAQDWGDRSNGAFDVTVQPLWGLYTKHQGNPPNTEIETALALVDYRAISVSARRIALMKPDMAITLNGIAQGFITDRVAALLRDRGFGNVLVNLGEMQAIGPRPAKNPDGQAWQIGIEDPDNPGALTTTLPLPADRALATSGGYGMRFDGRQTHLLDPATGLGANNYRSVSVFADNATTADALSTALTVLPRDKAAALVAATPGSKALIFPREGSSFWL